MRNEICRDLGPTANIPPRLVLSCFTTSRGPLKPTSVRIIPIVVAATLLALGSLALEAKLMPTPTPAGTPSGPRVIMNLKKVKGLYYSPAPEYPEEALEKHWGGSGLFEVQFRREGRVWAVFVTLSTGHKILDDAVVATLHQWRSWKGYKLIVVGAWIRFDPGARTESAHER